MRTILGISGLLLMTLCQCSAPKEKIPESPTITPSGDKMVIYQLLPRLFGNTKSMNKPFGTIEENGVGKLEDITDPALRGIKELGVTHILYSGIIEHALLSDYTSIGIPLDDADVVKGRAGNPYAIRDFYDIDPDLAIDVKNRMLEFQRLVDRTHQSGLKFILDFSPSYVARNYHSDVKPEGVIDLGQNDDRTKVFSVNNNFYYLPGQSFQIPKGYNSLGANIFPTKDGKFDETPAKVTGNDQFTATPALTDMFDVVKLNYGVDIVNGRKKYFDSIPDTWSRMRDILVFWAGKNVDGIRCEMSQNVPVEFWHWVIPQVKAINPELIFIGETDTPANYQNYLGDGRFDFLFDKTQLYDTLRLLMDGKINASIVAGVQKSQSAVSSSLVHFLENHNEQRIASPLFCTDPWKAIPAMVVSATIDKGPVMIYFGQEVGEPGAGAEGFGIEDGKTTLYDYWGVPEFQKWVHAKKYDGELLSDQQKALRQIYSKLLSLIHSPAFALGDYFDLTVGNVVAKNFSNKISAYARTYEGENLIILTNFNGKPEHVKVQLSPELIIAIKIDPNKKYMVKDLMNEGMEMEVSSSFLIEMDIPAFGYNVFKLN